MVSSPMHERKLSSKMLPNYKMFGYALSCIRNWHTKEYVWNIEQHKITTIFQRIQSCNQNKSKITMCPLLFTLAIACIRKYKAALRRSYNGYKCPETICSCYQKGNYFHFRDRFFFLLMLEITANNDCETGRQS